MLPLFRILWVAILACASASEAASPDEDNDETSLLQVKYRQSTDEEHGQATHQRQASRNAAMPQKKSKDGTNQEEDEWDEERELEWEEDEDKDEDEDQARDRCRFWMRGAPLPIRRAMYMSNHINVCRDYGVTDLHLSDFEGGTYIIRNPGIYRLHENIEMAPNTEFMMPPKDSSDYPMHEGYWLGFVAAIAVASDNVFIDLNDKSIAMSNEFLHRQRFFSIIQLGERPFEAATGPPQFSNIETSPFWASNVAIADGEIGMTSHTGVHGWNNNNIYMNAVHVKNFETAGIQINGATDVYIYNSHIGPSLGHERSSGRVPGLATLSQAQMLLRIVEGEEIEEQDPAFAALRESVERYISASLGGCDCSSCFGAAEQIFINADGLPDGSSLHGIVFHKDKIAIHDFASCPDFNGQEEGNFFGPVGLENVDVEHLLLKTDEVVSLQAANGAGVNTPIMGPAGDVLQAFRVRDYLPPHNYTGNVLSEAQLALGRLKLEHRHLDAPETFELFGATHIPQEFIDWTAGTKLWEHMMSELAAEAVCSKDAMTHFNKGVMGVRVEYYNDIELTRVTLADFENTGRASEVSHCTGDEDIYSGNDVRGLTVSHVSRLSVTDVIVRGMTTHFGRAFGVEERTTLDEFMYDISDVRGGLGSINRQQHLVGMLESDVGSDSTQDPRVAT